MTARKSISIPSTNRYTIGKMEKILLLGWLLLNLFFLLHRGIFLEGESEKYILQARLLLATGKPETSNYWLYSTQIFLIAACFKLHVSLYAAVAIQLLFNAIATIFFYRTLLFLFKDRRTAFIGTALLLADYFYQEFNTFLYTESLFYSFTLILSCYLFHIRQLTIRKVLIVIGMLAVICFTRPTGILFLPPAFLYLFMVFFHTMSTPKKIALLGFLGITFLFLLNMALGSGGELDIMLPFRDERIICGVPTLPRALPIKTAANGNSVYGLLYYILHNTPQFLKMVWWRTRAFLGLCRTYFSLAHNGYLIIFFYTLHLFALLGLPYWFKRHTDVFAYLLSAFLLTWLTVTLTCDDWHNRFYLNISPFLIILALPALQKLTKNRHDQ
jgi:hypothetical protein